MTTAIAAHRLSDQDVAQLRGLTDAWVHACLDADWDNLLTLVTDDIAFLASDAPIIEGKPALKAYLDGFPKILAMSADVVAAEGSHDLASARGTMSLTVEPAPGQRATMVGKWSATYRHAEFGGWLAASDAWNLDAPAPTA